MTILDTSRRFGQVFALSAKHGRVSIAGSRAACAARRGRAIDERRERLVASAARCG